MVLLDKVLFYSFQLMLIFLLRKKFGSEIGSGSEWRGCFLRLVLLGMFDSVEHSLFLKACSSCGSSDAHALNFLLSPA